MINKIKIKCKQCEKEFSVYPHRKKQAIFCSLKCRYNSMIGNSLRKNTQIEKICPLCNKIFKVKKSHKDKRKFCSQECYDKFRMNGAEIKICPVCNKKFRVKFSEKNRRHYCSYKCCYKTRKGNSFRVLIPKIKLKCKWCKKDFEKFPCRIKEKRGKYCSKECYTNGAVGENNWHWNNGSSFEPYSTDWTKTLKLSIRQRDNFICQLCGKEQELIDFSKAFDVHHIDYNKKNCNPDNLITLCKKCHTKTNHNREYWKQYFQSKINFCIQNLI